MNSPTVATNQAIYRLARVTRTFGGEFILRIDALDIMAGETLALVGPTGAGKSTLLRILTGYEPEVSGDVKFRNRPLHERSDLSERRRIAMVHQRSHLLSGDVAYNVGRGARWRGNVDEARLSALIDALGLHKVRHQHARSLSGGQTQLTGLARAVATGADVLLLDEPTANLDPARVSLVENVVQAHQRECGLTLVWATHNLHQARRVANRVALVLDGRLIEVAATEQFFNSPHEQVTRDFVKGRIVY